MSNYMEAKNLIIKRNILDIFNNDANFNFSFNEELVKDITDRVRKRKPLTMQHLNVFKNLRPKFDSDKQCDKFISECAALKDLDIKYDLLETGKINIFVGNPSSMGYERSLRLLKAIAESQISMHNILSNIPTNILYMDKWPEFIIKLLKYKLEINTFYKLLQVSNYQRILNAPSKDKLLNELAFIETKKVMSSNGDTVSEAQMLLKDFESSDEMRFSKSAIDITSIGSRTLCCFKKGSVGEPLMIISLKSPIAAILTGTILNITWFSFVWEIVEYNSSTDSYDINLILDNIEANNTLSFNDFNMIKDRLTSFNKYSKVYLGYLRNDISNDATNSCGELKDKSRNLVMFAKEFNRYGIYDDSKRVYTIINNDNDLENLQKYKIDMGELSRITYILEHKNCNDTVDFKVSDDVNTKLNRNFDLNLIDLDKSYILRNDKTIKGYELYNKQGELVYSL